MTYIYVALPAGFAIQEVNIIYLLCYQSCCFLDLIYFMIILALFSLPMCTRIYTIHRHAQIHIISQSHY